MFFCLEKKQNNYDFPGAIARTILPKNSKREEEEDIGLLVYIIPPPPNPRLPLFFLI